MSKATSIKNSFKDYSLKAGKLVMKDGKKYPDVLFIGCDKKHFMFLDKHVALNKIDPHEIKEFMTGLTPKEAI